MYWKNLVCAGITGIGIFLGGLGVNGAIKDNKSTMQHEKNYSKFLLEKEEILNKKSELTQQVSREGYRRDNICYDTVFKYPYPSREDINLARSDLKEILEGTKEQIKKIDILEEKANSLEAKIKEELQAFHENNAEKFKKYFITLVGGIFLIGGAYSYDKSMNLYDSLDFDILSDRLRRKRKKSKPKENS